MKKLGQKKVKVTCSRSRRYLLFGAVPSLFLHPYSATSLVQTSCPGLWWNEGVSPTRMPTLPYPVGPGPATPPSTPTSFFCRSHGTSTRGRSPLRQSLDVNVVSWRREVTRDPGENPRLEGARTCEGYPPAARWGFRVQIPAPTLRSCVTSVRPAKNLPLVQFLIWKMGRLG